MEQIYGNAYTAVAAVSSQNCEEGFIKRKDRLLFPFRNESGDTRVFGIYPPPNQADTQQEVPQSPWIKRGWTFQERIAATRILMFSKGSLHFDCKDFSNTQGRDEKVDRDYYYIMLDRETIDSGETAAIYQQWSKLRAQIKPKAHQLTRKTDFLPSIGGIASLFSKKLDDDYAAGLWKESMHQSLYWALSTTGKPSLQDLLKALKTPSPYIAPSWSWASRNEPFRFDLYHPDLSADCRREYHTIDTAITLRGESVFGEIKDAALDITSKLYVGSPRLTYEKLGGRFQNEKDLVRFDGRYFADIQSDCVCQDIFEPRPGNILAASISFLLIGSTIRRKRDAEGPSRKHWKFSYYYCTPSDAANTGTNSESSSTLPVSAESGGDLEAETLSKRAAYSLLIHPTENPNEYYRLGTFFSQPEFAGGLSFFDNVEVRTVKLV
ncbi:hypothetical protein H9Q69_007393 [Fusarium xylarioides]|nr:hypothetical protein H9Q69_007393 [Fusarium xylarioides]